MKTQVETLTFNEMPAVKVSGKIFINLTPHPVNLFIKDTEVIIPRSNKLIRLGEIYPNGKNNLINIKEFTMPEGFLPKEQKNVYYIVSPLVLLALPREDFVCPDQLIRDKEGRIIGCKSFYQIAK